MDPNRRGLALMTSALLLSLMVVSMRSCNDRAAVKYARLDTSNTRLIQQIYEKTRPIRDYRVRTVEDGVMTVEAGPTLGPEDLQNLARKLTQALYDADHDALHSDLVMVDIQRHGKTVCQAQTSAQGIWVKLRE